MAAERADQAAPRRIVYSFVVDAHPRFAYQGWQLAHSLADCGNVRPADICVQCTRETDPRARALFGSIGCRVVTLDRFGDGQFCNKLAQWDNMRHVAADHFVFLDTDMLAIAPCGDTYPADAIGAKPVDLASPPIRVLRDIFAAAGFTSTPRECPVDSGREPTFVGNCNGGMYSVPRQHAAALFTAWKRWALWLLDNIEPLRRAGREANVDQVSFCLALHETALPFVLAPSNLNYYLRFAGTHTWFDPGQPISMLHYGNSLDVFGVLSPAGAATAVAAAAVSAANRQMARRFHPDLFARLRYADFSEAGCTLRGHSWF